MPCTSPAGHAEPLPQGIVTPTPPGRLPSRLLLASSLCTLVACGRPPRLDGATVRVGYEDSIDSWNASVTVPGGWTWTAGQNVDLPVTISAEMPLLKANPAAWDGLWVVVWGERIYDASGRYTQESGLGLSSFLTPSGLPVESFQWDPPVGALGAHYRSPVEGVAFLPAAGLTTSGSHIKLSTTVTVKVDPACPDGIYRTHVRLMARLTDGHTVLDASRLLLAFSPYMVGANPDPLAVPMAYDKMRNMLHPSAFLPAIRVGHPADPQLVVALFTDTVANGIRGVLSKEDATHVAIARRTVYGSRLVLQPGTYGLDASPVAYFPQRLMVGDAGGNSHTPKEIPDFLDFSKGDLAVRVTDPDGRVTEQGRQPLLGVEDGILRSQALGAIHLKGTGRYQVELDGWTADLVGNRYVIRGTYEVWCARPLSFSTAAKIGTSFFVGGQFPPKVQVHPLVPAYVKLDIRFFPRSDAARMKEVVQQGYANPFGYFIPGTDQPRLRFDEPGEYAVDIAAAWHDAAGDLWLGTQVAAGVVAEEHPDVQLHGVKVAFEGTTGDSPDYGLKDRFRTHHESSLGRTDVDFTDTRDSPPPYHSGDVMYLATTNDGANSINPILSESATRPDVLAELTGLFAREPYFATHNSQGIVGGPLIRDGLRRLLPFSDVLFQMKEPARTGQLPILSRSANGFSPYDYPEDVTVRNYYYFSAIRPGFPAFTDVSDSTAYQSYWTPSPNLFGQLTNAGPTGDLPQDLYRIDGGLVYRDTVTGVSSYSAYASTVVMQPRESYSNRTLAPAEEPLVRVNGEDYPLFLAVEAAAVLTPGEPLALAAVVFPAVPAHVRMSLTDPSGVRKTVEGDANQIGMFAPREGLSTLTMPGAYTVEASVSYQGKTGGVYGSVGIPYYHFVVPPDAPRIIKLAGIPEYAEYDPRNYLDVPIEVSPAIHDAVLHWVVMCPGILMDRGQLALPDNRFTYRFMATHFAIQFPNYQVVDYSNGDPVLAKSTFLVFFVEGKDASGKIVQDVRYVLLRRRSLFAPSQREAPNDASRHALDGLFGSVASAVPVTLPPAPWEDKAVLRGKEQLAGKEQPPASELAAPPTHGQGTDRTRAPQ